MSVPADLNVIHAASLARIQDSGTARRGDQQGRLDLVADGAVAIRSGRIAAVGSTGAVLARCPDPAPTLDATGLTVLPGLVECHSHPIYAGRRHWEYPRRIQGAGFRQLRAEGGGIWSTIMATRAAADQDLVDQARRAYAQILAGGATTLEVKSGYGLTLDQELRLLRQSAQGTPLDLVYTFLGAHVAPQDGRTAEAWAAEVRDSVLEAVQAQGIAQFHDVSCEEGDYSAPVALDLLEASRRRGMPTRVHADASADSLGWRTAVAGGAVAADHLTYTPDQEIRSVGETGTIAVLLPVAIATDYCSSFQATSLLLSMALACSWFRLLPAEAVVAATLNAAYVLGRGHDRGSLDLGKRGDLTILGCEHPDEIGVRIGAPLVRYVVSQGRVVHAPGAPGAEPALPPHP